ncbi:hypothetical protein ACROYT_G021142 [Oculina patagonica]
MGIHWPEVITNEELWTTTEQERINIQIRRRKWGWIGHTLRKTNCNVTKQALRWNPQGKRSRGRPRNSWRRTVDDEASKAGYTWTQIERIAQNRTRWRAVVSVDLCSMGSERSLTLDEKDSNFYVNVFVHQTVVPVVVQTAISWMLVENYVLLSNEKQKHQLTKIRKNDVPGSKEWPVLPDVKKTPKPYFIS